VSTQRSFTPGSTQKGRNFFSPQSQEVKLTPPREASKKRGPKGPRIHPPRKKGGNLKGSKTQKGPQFRGPLKTRKETQPVGIYPKRKFLKKNIQPLSR